MPEIGPGEMLVRVDACGVCGTDLKKIEKGLLPPPRIFGHEIAGRVAGVGRGRDAASARATRVVVHHHIPCRACFYCRRRRLRAVRDLQEERHDRGLRALGRRLRRVRARHALDRRAAGPSAFPTACRPEEAAFVEPVNTCLKAVRKAGVRPGETVLVVGQGPIGSMLMQLAAGPAPSVIVSDRFPTGWRWRGRSGRRSALDAAGDVVAEVRGADRGPRRRRRVPGGGRASGRSGRRVDATRPGGRVVPFAATSPGETGRGGPGRARPLREGHPHAPTARPWTCRTWPPQLVFARQVRVAELVTHRFPLAEAPQAVALRVEPGARAC